MKGNISFVRVYTPYHEKCYDVLYKSNRMCSGLFDEMPATVKAFIDSHTPKVQQDKYYGEEIIYK